MAALTSEQLDELVAADTEELYALLGAASLSVTSSPIQLLQAGRAGQFYESPPTVCGPDIPFEHKGLKKAAQAFLQQWGSEIKSAICGNDAVLEAERHKGREQLNLLIATIVASLTASIPWLSALQCSAEHYCGDNCALRNKRLLRSGLGQMSSEIAQVTGRRGVASLCSGFLRLAVLVVLSSGLSNADIASQVRIFVSALSDQDAQIREGAVDALAALKGEKEALEGVGPQIAPLLKDPDPNVRYAAAKALQVVTYNSEAIIDALIEALSDSSPLVRDEVVSAIGSAGVQGSRASARLLDLSATATGTCSIWLSKH